MRVRSTNGVTVAVHDYGGHGEPFLICHATGFHGRAYESLAEALARRHHVWAVDIRAHGDSTPPEADNFSWKGTGDDVLAAVDGIGAEHLHVFGHSMGGAAAMLAEVARPGLLRTAYLYEPIIFPAGFLRPGEGERPTTMADNARRRREVFPTKPDALWHFSRRFPLSALQARSLAAYVEHGFEDLHDGTVRLKCRAEHEARMFEVDDAVTVETLAGVTTPVTIALGEAEPGTPPAMMARGVAEGLPNGRLLTYLHLGHLGPLQDPETVADDILAVTAP